MQIEEHRRVKPPDISVIIPMFNEEENVENTTQRVADALSTMGDNWEIVIVNDGSTDNTLEIAQNVASKDSGIRVVSYPQNGGRGKALRTGFANVYGNIVVTTDADLSYDPKYIIEMVKALQTDEEVDFILASPYMQGGATENVPWKRLLISKLGNKFLGYVMPGNFTTITCVFRAYRRYVLDSLELESDGKEIHLEILAKALSAGYKAKEIPAVLTRRKKGKSKFRFKKTAISHLLFSLNIKPMLFFGVLGALLFGLGMLIGGYICVLWFGKSLNPERPLVTLMVLLILTGVQMFSFGFLAINIGILRKEIYKVQKQNRLLERKIDKDLIQASSE